MRKTTIILAGTLLLTLTSQIGCASSSGWFASKSTSQSPAVASTPGSASSNMPAGSNQPAFNGRPDQAAMTARSGFQRVGLYGDFLDNGPSQGPIIGESGGNLFQITFGNEGADSDPSVDSEGKWIVFSSTQHRPNSDLYLKPINGSTITQLTNDSSDEIMPTFSPDGKRIAYASNRSGNWDIYVMPSMGGKAVQLTDDAAHDLHPSWSADGRRIVYSRFGTQSQRWEIWVVDLDNPGVKHFVDYGLFPRWSPDITSNKILFQRARERGSRYHGIWTIDFENGQGSRPTEIVSAGNAATINPAWSPDGQHIVFSTVLEPEKNGTDRPAFAELWIVRVDGTGRTSLTRGEFSDVQPVWGADGRVYFVSNRSGRDSIWAMSPSWLRKTNDTDPGTLVSVPVGGN